MFAILSGSKLEAERRLAPIALMPDDVVTAVRGELLVSFNININILPSIPVFNGDTALRRV